MGGWDSPEQQRIYQRKWKAQRRQKWIEDQGGLCVRCESTEELEIDHIDRSTKEYEITNIWSRKADIREAELAKCQVLCKVCHLEKTTSENNEDWAFSVWFLAGF